MTISDNALERPVPFDDDFASEFDAANVVSTYMSKYQSQNEVYIAETETYRVYLRTYGETGICRKSDRIRDELAYRITVELGGSHPACAFGDEWIACRELEVTERNIEPTPQLHRQMAKHIIAGQIDLTSTHILEERGHVYIIDIEPWWEMYPDRWEWDEWVANELNGQTLRYWVEEFVSYAISAEIIERAVDSMTVEPTNQDIDIAQSYLYRLEENI